MQHSCFTGTTMERENKCIYFSVSSGHWEHIFQELLWPSKAAVSAVHGLGGPVSTTGGPVHAVTWHRYLRTDFPGEHSFVTRKGTTMQCPEIGRGRNLRGEPPMRSLTLFALLQTWGKEDTSELLGMAALPPHSPLLSSQEHAPEQSNPSPISLNQSCSC